MATCDGRVEVDGHAIHWESRGDPHEPLVVFLHHGLGSAQAWHRQLDDFAAAGWQALAYDRWGYGASDARPALDLPDFATDLRDLIALLDSVGARSAALVGHSDGGTIALRFAADHPDRVTALVVVAAHIYVEPSMVPGMQALADAFASQAAFRRGLQRAHGEKYVSVFENWFGGWVQPKHLGWDMRPVLRRITRPTLVIQGELDEHARPQHARDLADCIVGSALWMIPEAGHMPAQDLPELFNPRVLDFLAPYRLAADSRSG